MKKAILIALLALLVILLLTMGGGVRVPGETTQKEQRVIRGMSIANEISV
jgi:hypothetical protein